MAVVDKDEAHKARSQGAMHGPRGHAAGWASAAAAGIAYARRQAATGRGALTEQHVAPLFLFGVGGLLDK